MSWISFMTTEHRSSSASTSSVVDRSLSLPVVGAVASWLGYTLLCALMIYWDEPVPAGLVAVLVGLLAAGCSLTCILVNAQFHLDVAEWTLLAIACSMAIGGMLGTALTYTPQGLRGSSYLCSLWIFTFICMLTGLGRRYAYTHGAIKIEKNQTAAREQASYQLRSTEALTLITNIGLACFVLFGAFTLTGNLNTSTGNPYFTEFYLLNSQTTMTAPRQSWIPTHLVNVRYGIVNKENDTAVYQVCAKIESTQIYCTPPTRLQAGATWEAPIAFELWPTVDPVARLDFDLMRNGNRYRSLHLWYDFRR